MNAKTLIAAALALVGTASFADEVRDYATPSTVTRAEVRAELNRAQAANELVAQADSYGTVQATMLAERADNGRVASLSRVEVKKDLARAQAEGTLVAGEAYGTVVPGASVRSRADVRAEAVVAARTRVDASQYSGS